MVSHPSLGATGGFCAKLSECREKACLTSSKRALAWSSGNRRRPAVAFRTTGVLPQSSSGTVFLATFSSCRMVSPPCRRGDNRLHASRSLNGENYVFKLRHFTTKVLVKLACIKRHSSRERAAVTASAGGVFFVIIQWLHHMNPTQRKSQWFARVGQLPNLPDN